MSRALTLDDVTFIELWEAMLAIAPRTAALAAAHARPENLERLELCIRRVETARSAEGAVGGVVDFFGSLAATSAQPRAGAGHAAGDAACSPPRCAA